jgi:uncharacterized protein YcbX
LRIGCIEFPTLYGCDRCSITTIDQASGEHGVEPLKTLATYRARDGKVWFGQRMIHRGSGRLGVGDAIEVPALPSRS